MIYPFNTKTDLDPDDEKHLLGGKGANLARMNRLGLPVPPGFTIPTYECFSHQEFDKVRENLFKEIRVGVSNIEKSSGKMFGSPSKPLLFSVRSGAKVSMPGMMDTVLNIGLNDQTVEGLAKLTNEDFAWDSYRRFLEMYGVTVLGLPESKFAELYETMQDITCNSMPIAKLSKILVDEYKAIYKKHHKVLPHSVWKQLDQTIMAVFRSWFSKKAKTYRKIEGISADLGTAVNIQTMVFGNMNQNSGTGVVFTRNPNTGENKPYGDFLVNAQGEDVVAGTHETLDFDAMGQLFPSQTSKLMSYITDLELSLKDMCDIEFTIEDGKLWMLQVRTGKRSPQAAIRIASDLVSEGIISETTAKERVELIKDIPVTESKNDLGEPDCIGKGASPGIVSGVVALSSKKAIKLVDKGHKVILLRKITDPKDIEGMSIAEGILTTKGGLVSHAAVVARSWAKPCVVGCDAISVDIDDDEDGWNDNYVIGAWTPDGDKIKEGITTVTINGSTGEVWFNK